MRGFAFINTGESAKAIECFKLCLQEKPDLHLARISLANALRRYCQYDESIVQLETLKSVFYAKTYQSLWTVSLPLYS